MAKQKITRRMNQNQTSLIAALLVAILLSACGEDSSTEKIVEVAAEHTAIVADVSELPKCNKDNEGGHAYVKGETSERICVDGKWFALKESEGVSDFDFSCTTKELKDKSGLKIICNGDSIGVVLNGAKGDAGEQGIQGQAGKQGEKGDAGETGKDGTGCSIAAQTDSTVTIKCGEKSLVLNMGGKGGFDIVDTLEIDSEKIAISLDTLSGFSQKGPFLKGSTVYLYELSDGRTLKQTNGNFTSEITSDDGRYSFQSRDLVSQYALIVVDGKYQNEVTGKPTTTNIKLQAYTNMLMRKSANVNLLTHLEKNRVFYLVTKKGMTVRAAKKQAQAEIFKQFHIDTTGFKSESEDLDVFGKTDADAALLAISILLQGEDDETALSVLLTEISGDMEKDGLWNKENAAANMATIADWALAVDDVGKLETYRTNVKNWGVSTTVPHFEKYIRRFASVENGLGVCGSDSIPVGTVKEVTNEKSAKYYAESYTAQNNSTRFICVDADSVKWRIATNIEKDTMGWGHRFTDGDIRNGRVNTTMTYVYQDKNWRKGTDVDSLVGKGCVTFRQDTVAQASNNEWYICKSNSWRTADNIEKDTATWGAGNFDGEVKPGRVNTDIYYIYEVSKKAWRIAEPLEYDTYQTDCLTDGSIIAGRVDSTNKYVCDAGAFRIAKNIEIYNDEGCTSYNRNSTKILNKDANGAKQYSYYRCTEDGWTFTLDSLNRGTVVYEGQTYKTIGIKTQMWMAENLNYEVENSYCNDNYFADSCSKYGRFYIWSAAVGKSEEECGYNKTCGLTGTVRGICPEGWHIPTSSEWNTLYSAIGKSPYAMQAKGYDNWSSATDAYGFSAHPAGYYSARSYGNVGLSAYFWSATEGGRSAADSWKLDASDAYLTLSTRNDLGYSVRCLKD